MNRSLNAARAYLMNSPHFDSACALAAANEPVAARAEIEAAAKDGDPRAGIVHSGFLAGGVGGPRDWSAAVGVLRKAGNEFASRQVNLIDAMDLAPDGAPVSTPEPTSLHERIQLVPGLLSPEECAFLIQASGPRFKPAALIGDSNAIRQESIRDNDAAMFRPVATPAVLHAITRRIAAASGTDDRQGEPIQVMRYRPGQQYRTHVDAIPGVANNRVMSAIVYLNGDYEGGETEFPRLDIRIKGKVGDMLLFRNLTDDGRLDPDMCHAGLPVTAGVKFIATRWILQRPAYDEHGRLMGKTLWD